MRLFLVDLPYACYGIEVDRHWVTTVPPIARWMRGQHIDRVRRWVQGKGGWISEVA